MIRRHAAESTVDTRWRSWHGLRTLGEMHAQRLPPHAYFVVSAVFHYLGPSFAVLLFARVDVLGVAWLRIASAALIFAVWRRPWRAFARLDRDGRRAAPGLGRRAGADELLLLPRDQPPAARDGRGDRVPAGRRPGGARRAQPAQPRCAAARRARRLPADRRAARGRAARRGVRVRQRGAVRGLHRARRPRREAREPERHRRARGIDADRGRRGHAAGRLGGRPGAGRSGRARGRDRRGRVVLGHPVRHGSARAGAPGARDLRALVSLLPAVAAVIGVVVLGADPDARSSSPGSRSSSPASRCTGSVREIYLP